MFKQGSFNSDTDTTNFGTQSNLSIKRLLLKLGLINQSLFERPFIVGDPLPVGYFAARGCYEESWAIEQIAADLNISVCKFDRTTEERAVQLLGKEPLSLLPLSEWREARALPVSLTDEEVQLCMADPLDLETIRRIEFTVNRRVRALIGQEKQISEIISKKIEGRHEVDLSELFSRGEPLEIKQSVVVPFERQESTIVAEDGKEPIAIKLVNRILSSAIRQGASDIHITPEASQLAVRIRVDGILRDLLQVPKVLIDSVTSRVKILCQMDITEKRKPQDARLRLGTNFGQRDLRISTIPTAFGEDIVIRVLSSELADISLGSLGMPEEIEARFTKMLRSPSKVHLVTGPTGSGKTSSLYAGLLYLRDGTNRIITIEDPIEYRIPGVSQIQVNTKIGMTFASALRSILRQDPDVILLGEIRDGETASTAMQVAQTGHLVLSTLHTNSAPAAITRLRDLGIESYVIASGIGSITAQRLVRRLCTYCQKAEGCEECGHTGYRGRIAIFSFLEMTPVIVNAIREGASEEVIANLARENGYFSLEESGLALVEAGITSLKELERVLGPIDRRVVEELDSIPSIVSSGIQKRKLLLVDDDDDLRMMFQYIFEAQMFDVVQARDGKGALEAVYSNPPDVIVLDVMMPGMNGHDVVERLKGDRRTRNIPVLMLTAASTEDLELEFMKKGADDFVSKSSRSELIIARINRLLNRAE